MIQLILNQGTKDGNHLTTLQAEVGEARTCLWMAFPFWSTKQIAEVFVKIYPRIDDPGPPLRIKWLLSLDARSLLAGSSDLGAIFDLHENLVEPGLIDLEVRYLTPGNEGTLHAKTFIFDDSRALITSSNPSKNGLQKNLEAGVLTDESSVVQPLLQAIKNAWETARELSLEEADRINKEIQDAKKEIKDASDSIMEKAKSIQIEPAIHLPDAIAPIRVRESVFSGISLSWFDHLKEGEASREAVEECRVNLVHALKQPFKDFWSEVRAKLTPDVARLNYHFSQRLQLRKRYPSFMWFAISRDPRKYIPISHLACGIGLKERLGKVFFLGFKLNEEYGDNDERRPWVTRVNRQREVYFNLFRRLHEEFQLQYGLGKERKVVPIHQVDDAIIDYLVQAMDQRLDIAIQRYYPVDKYGDLLNSPRLVPEVASQLKALFPLMSVL